MNESDLFHKVGSWLFTHNTTWAVVVGLHKFRSSSNSMVAPSGGIRGRRAAQAQVVTAASTVAALSLSCKPLYIEVSQFRGPAVQFVRSEVRCMGTLDRRNGPSVRRLWFSPLVRFLLEAPAEAVEGL